MIHEEINVLIISNDHLSLKPSAATLIALHSLLCLRTKSMVEDESNKLTYLLKRIQEFLAVLTRYHFSELLLLLVIYRLVTSFKNMISFQAEYWEFIFLQNLE